MNYWLFNCNPKIWDIEEFLSNGESYSTWKINNAHSTRVKKGDFGFIRVGHDHRTKSLLNGRQKLLRGIYAIVEIIGNPIHGDDIEDNYWIADEKRIEKVWRVPFNYVYNLIDNPILIDDLALEAKIEKRQAIIKGMQTITYQIPESDYTLIVEHAKTNLNLTKTIQNEKVITTQDIIDLEKKYAHESPKIKERISKVIERGHISKEIKKIYNHECMICKELGMPAKGFLKRNLEPYIETHHFFPVSELRKGSLGPKNLMTLCANHHREIHYGMIDSIESNEEYFVLSIKDKRIHIKKKIFDL